MIEERKHTLDECAFGGEHVVMKKLGRRFTERGKRCRSEQKGPLSLLGPGPRL